MERYSIDRYLNDANLATDYSKNFEECILDWPTPSVVIDYEAFTQSNQFETDEVSGSVQIL